MSAPTSKFSRLSLEAMTPTTRSQALLSRESSPSASSSHSSSSDSSYSSSSSDSESEPDTPTVRSPSKLVYRVSHLSPETQAHIRDVFSDPPQLALQRCRLVNNQNAPMGTFAFQMTELVTRSVRVRREGVSCSCGGGGVEEDEDGDEIHRKPCGHLLWLMDKIAEQTLYKRGEPLNMTEQGFPAEMDDPFTALKDHTLDVVGPSLHCPVVNSPHQQDAPDAHRILEARQLLASAHGEAPDSFRPDIFDGPRDALRRAWSSPKKAWRRGDLDLTVTRMLLDDHHFFDHFLRDAERAGGAVKDPFRRLGERVERILEVLEGSGDDEMAPEPPGMVQDDQEQMKRDVPWAARHILGCASLIRSLIFTRSRPLSPPESLSAARSLVHILTQVTSGSTGSSSRGLYLSLIGDRDRDFVIGTLGLVPPAAASQFLDTLQGCLEDIGRYGAPAGYVERFRKLLDRLRTSSVVGTKRAGQDAGARGSKRMK